MRWDPNQYAKYADERGRPFRELLDRIGAAAPRRVVDLGCGTGTLTTWLADRWPQAQVVGIDSSPDMIAAAQALGDRRVQFELADIATWEPTPDVDVVITNAALQWVPDHIDLLRQWTTTLPAGSWLAWQVPGNFAAPSHELMRKLVNSARWTDRLGGVLRHHDAVGAPANYAGLLLDAGWSADVWETTYIHRLTGNDPVLDWLRGTGLRPILTELDGRDPSGRERLEFEREFATRLREAYPPTRHGTLLPYRRIFAVGHNAGANPAG